MHILILCTGTSQSWQVSQQKKKLDMYEAMTIVVGKDMATGNYAKSYANIDLEKNTEVQSISI